MTILHGVVDHFDADVGLGAVRTADGASYRFHCTTIADGSRTIEVGRDVTFLVAPAGPGHWEATVVAPTPLPPAPAQRG